MLARRPLLPAVATRPCCALTGTLPPWIYDLRELDLGMSKLRGSIPSPSAAQQAPLGQIRLSLNYNQLTGCARALMLCARVRGRLVPTDTWPSGARLTQTACAVAAVSQAARPQQTRLAAAVHCATTCPLRWSAIRCPSFTFFVSKTPSRNDTQKRTAGRRHTCLLGSRACRAMAGARARRAAADADPTLTILRRTLPPALARMPRLYGLLLHGNVLTGTLPDAWGANGSFPSLTGLALVRAAGLRLG